MKLLFVFTFKGSIEKWTKEGIANREMEVLFEYLRKDMFEEIILYSYAPNDAEYLKKLNFEPELKKRIKLIMPERKPKSLKDLLAHSFDFKKIRQAVDMGAKISKTNQINGAWTAFIAQFFGIKMLLRCGYILSRRLFKNKQWPQGIVALIIEAICANNASSISVTTEDAKAYFSSILLFNRKKIFVAPTYVNTEIFNADIRDKEDTKRLLYVGRLEPQKNVLEMVEACKIANVALTVVGKGSLQKQMLDKAEELGVVLEHHPSLMNEEIADMFRTHKYFILPSLHEGLPKVLIEAMSGQMVCIGTPTSGTTDLIIVEKTGFLSDGFTAKDIAKAIEQAVGAGDLAITCATNARNYVMENHSISAYADREYGKIKEVLS